jgi:hypothetical protein
MSFKIRVLWVLPVLVAGSWLAVRSLAASPAEPLDDPPLASSRPAPELHDPALARFIAEQAARLRGER